MKLKYTNLMGHTKVETTEKYAHLIGDLKQREAMGRIAGLFSFSTRKERSKADVIKMYSKTAERPVNNG